MTLAARKPSAGFSVGVTCPGCGANVLLEDNFFVLECNHCGSILRVIPPDAPPAYVIRPLKAKQEIRFLLDRYCRDNSLPSLSPGSPSQLIYYPYWKIDAATLRVRSTVYDVDFGNQENPDDRQTEERELTTVNLSPFITTSPAGATVRGVPHALGLRAEYIRMTPFVEGTIPDDASCIPVTRKLQDAAGLATRAAESIGKIHQDGSVRNETRLFHPTGSIVYFPYYLIDSYSTGVQHRYVADGVTGRIVGDEPITSEVELMREDLTALAFGALTVHLHRCSNCGVDLPMSRSSVYQCHNCQRVEFFDNHPALNREIGIVGKQGRADALFPFWSLRFASEIMSIFGGSNHTNRIVIPAFDLRNLESAYRLAKRMTTASSHLPVEQLRAIDRQHIPVTRSLSESLTLLEVLWYRELAGRDAARNQDYVTPEPGEIRLFFAPFHEERYFFVDSVLQAVTFERGSYQPVVA